ncbi:secretin N-terminal domain-containing protein, partial [Pseudomonas sp. GP01-A4]|uniref:secretin N-terminal domain-containing protein n=2 Tax=Pseudomonadota TaxID=1224 RepID=UPI000CB57F49
NSLVIVDFADNVRRVREVIRQIDTDTAATRIVALKNAGAREIATALQALTGQGAGGGGPSTGSSASVVAVTSSNSVAIRGDAASV